MTTAAFVKHTSGHELRTITSLYIAVLLTLEQWSLLNSRQAVVLLLVRVDSVTGWNSSRTLMMQYGDISI
jgi:hypothetical protein